MKILVFILHFSVYLINLVCSSSGHENHDDVLLCRSCGQDIVMPSGVLQGIASTKALRRFNRTVLGNPKTSVHVFRNPSGRTFEVITTSEANVDGGSEWISEFSWYPGYSWKIATCSQCRKHVGWLFHRDVMDKGNTPKYFVGLILDRLIHQSYADSLISGPKRF